jgi:hypothetical protein
MKKLPLLLLIVLLSACTTVTPSPTSTAVPTNTVLPATSAAAPTQISRPTASPELLEYVDKVFLILDDVSQASEELEQLFMVAKARNDFTNEAWVERVNKNFDSLLESADKIEAIEPVPPQAESAHEYFTLASEELRLFISVQQEVAEGNIDAEEFANDYMQLYLTNVRRGLDEVYQFQP